MPPSIGTRRSTFNKRRHGVMAFIMPWFKRFGIFVLAVMALISLGGWLVWSGAAGRLGVWAEQKALAITADMGFRVRNIMVEGRVHTNPDLLLGIVNVQKEDPLFSFDPVAAQDLIEKLAWVKAVHIERRMPDTLYILITEHTPVALYQHQGSLSLIDEEGAFIVQDDLSTFKDLILVIGEDAAPKAPAFFELLKAEQNLYARTKAVRWIGGRRWDIEFDNGIIAKLPEQDVSLALRRLAEAQNADNLLEKNIVQIDVREPERLIVRAAPGAIEALEKKDAQPGVDKDI